jgi:hypothetical protein
VADVRVALNMYQSSLPPYRIILSETESCCLFGIAPVVSVMITGSCENELCSVTLSPNLVFVPPLTTSRHQDFDHALDDVRAHQLWIQQTFEFLFPYVVSRALPPSRSRRPSSKSASRTTRPGRRSLLLLPSPARCVICVIDHCL